MTAAAAAAGGGKCGVLVPCGTIAAHTPQTIAVLDTRTT